VDLDGDRTISPSSDDEQDWDSHATFDPAWHGIILPASDADAWLAQSFGAFHDYVGRANQIAQQSKNVMKPVDRDELAVKLFGARSDYLAAARRAGDVPLTKIKPDTRSDEWANIAGGRGMLLLAELRRRLGDEKFDALMDSFGRENAGKKVTTQQFIAAAEKASGTSLSEFFDAWLNTSAQPTLKLEKVDSQKQNGAGAGYIISGIVASSGGVAPASVDVTIQLEASDDDADNEITQTVNFTDRSSAAFSIPVDRKPTRVIVNKYGMTPCANGCAFGLRSFGHDLDQTLIVYGTREEVEANREAAEKLQKQIIEHGENFTVPIKSDQEVREDELANHHLIVIGRPDSNSLLAKVRETLPITFGPRSFVLRGETYANPESAILFAMENPFAPKHDRAMVCVAGLSASSTVRTAPHAWGWTSAQAKIFPAYGEGREIVFESKELVRELK
jgi:hypothetical protein